ncbi:MAG: hypothetical protein IPM41_16210 [Sphingomonadales bacterium]|nr:hypothetical protein [Sphingomonadales bacterium]MBK9005331.1 hypothetical protein [Sphingomonadales bacterium]
MTRHFNFHMEIEREDDCLEVFVCYSVAHGEAEIDSAEFCNVDRALMPAPLTDAEFEAIQERCVARMESDLAEDAADYGDWLHEQRRYRMAS